MRSFYNTLDIDTNEKGFAERILKKILAKPCCLNVDIRVSSQKGYHVMLLCKFPCDTCRLVFDSPKRFAEDLQRPEKCRNVLFDFKGKVSMVKK
ncbi:hypothetical protein MUO79_01450 [Candidatus Bathyarchaeota archaeon]|nr:hypothetical protein [Candidatus Bathyarchaeota archaeon]